MRPTAVVVALATLLSGALACDLHVHGGNGDPARRPAGDLLVFAAASLKTALDELTPVLERASGARLRVSYAATSALAKQVEAGAPAALFISADQEWMDYLEARALVRPDTRVNLLGNRLVLIAPADQPVSLALTPGVRLREVIGDGRLAVADPDTVPAGKYARAALGTLGVWQTVEDRLARAENVRAALLFVARGEAPLGVVYETDARSEPRVQTVAVFPESTHPPIVYPAAVTVAADAAKAGRVLSALCSPAAGAVFTRHGFRFLPR